MSGCSYSEKCPKCGGEMTCYSDWKPHDMVSGICLECGFAYDTIDRQATLYQVNETRQALELQRVTALKASQ
jgi:Zn ribbon nucleic-acid-binding protein